MKIYFWKKFRIKKVGENLSVLNQRTPFWKPFLLLLPSLLTITLMTIIPFILVIIDSFSVRVGFKAHDIGFGFENFKNIFNDIHFKIGVRNAFVYSIVSLPISLCISLLISTSITMLIKKWSRNFWQTVFFLPYVTSAIAVSITFFFIFKKEGGFVNIILKNLKLIDKPIPFLESGDYKSWKPFIVILLRGIWGSLAFQILILSTAMLSVNPQLYKSASIDGSYKFKQFFAITLPSIKRTISFLITMGLIGGIKVFPLSLFNNNELDALNNGGSSLMLYVYRFVKQGSFSTGAAASIMLFLIGVLVSFSLRKLVSITYIIGTKIGEKNVIRKIENQTLKTKPVFKI
ncbi:sn-glycerol-3-phosphate transport system permease protein ugpA [Metamycoplasma cloacale]|uniref:Sugar ABC transporter permease n=1 Tax=Metamycoplasma cloacale TaxID=92401 RepID=A0A2Z4LM87_9BACT|nr:sugar ABC transporter permease [Metamycoplasma cloacale]AWX42875.1 sugar ABC transporter permease [Metamycoplasma cloacale]VEU79301.1 sn-glycerol-3-phosphate transport system permease protein ugpA [Metamycoplasma cloacale]